MKQSDFDGTEKDDPVSDFFAERSTRLTKELAARTFLDFSFRGREVQNYHPGERVIMSDCCPFRGRAIILDAYEENGFWYYRTTCGKVLRTKDIANIVEAPHA